MRIDYSSHAFCDREKIIERIKWKSSPHYVFKNKKAFEKGFGMPVSYWWNFLISSSNSLS